MTTKEQYSTDEWADIPLRTFKEMLDQGYEVEYCLPASQFFVRAQCDGAAYDEDDAPFRTKRSEYMRYINRTRSDQNDSLADPLRQAGARAKVDCHAAQRSDVKSRPDLLPSKAVLAAGRVLAFGQSKHPDEEWKTLSVEDHVGAALRHVYEHQNGPDPETGESHLAHALCRIAFAIARSEE